MLDDLGLIGMKERAEMTRGTFQVLSSPDGSALPLRILENPAWGKYDVRHNPKT